jgi:hypothetical protein
LVCKKLDGCRGGGLSSFSFVPVKLLLFNAAGKFAFLFPPEAYFFSKPQNVNLLAGGKPAFCHALKSSDLIRRRTHVFKPSF